MPIILICGLPFGGGERLAKNLSEKLGYSFLNREEVVARANECGIPVGKLEVAMVKKPAVQERLARLKERYLAVATSTICEKAALGNLVYFGRAGHLLLPGVKHVLRVRLVPEPGARIEIAMQRLRLGREKAEAFLRDVDEDIRSWVRFVYGVHMDDPTKYDFVVNLENISIENAATALCSIADLPDFRPTPSSRRAMDDRLLQARARIRLALDERTADLDLTVRASDEVVTITYMPLQARQAARIPDVLGEIPGCREIRCTMAGTNILWVAERFSPDSDTFRHVSEMARRWDAAVELLQYEPCGADGEPARGAEPESPPADSLAAPGGIEDDLPESPIPESNRTFRQTQEALVLAGRSGGGQIVCGTRERLISAINPAIPYTLVAVGDLFLDKPAAASTRMTRELSGFLAHRVKAPVVSTAELRARLRLGMAQILKVAAAGVVAAALYAILFTHQAPILDMLGGDYHRTHRWVAPVLVGVLAPAVAGLLGTVAGFLMKVAKFE